MKQLSTINNKIAKVTPDHHLAGETVRPSWKLEQKSNAFNLEIVSCRRIHQASRLIRIPQKKFKLRFIFDAITRSIYTNNARPEPIYPVSQRAE